MNRLRTFSGSLLISGTTIGAGMLGIPLVTAASGFFPGVLISILVWFFMYCTALLFLEVTLWMPDGNNVLSMSKKFLGPFGRFFSGAVFIFLYYCLMVAYFDAGAPLLARAFSFFGFPLSPLMSFILFGISFGLVVTLGPKFIDRTNVVISVAMIAAWFLLVGSGASEVRQAPLKVVEWHKMFFAMPVFFSAFGFHNVIPSLSTYLKRDRKALRSSIFWGSLIPLIVYIVWQWLIIGSIPKEDIIYALKTGVAITDTFQTQLSHPYFITCIRFFSFFAIVTSMLGVSFSMVDFLGDGLKVKKRVGCARLFLSTLTFVPPMVFSIFYPDVFASALGVAGGYGEAFLNGLLPISLLWVGKYMWELETDLKWLENRYMLTLLALYAFFVIGLETFHLFS